MGGRFSHVHYREQDAAVLPHFLLLTQVWGLDEIAFLSVKLRKISFNFCLSRDQFAELLALRSNPLFRTMLENWFASFQNTKVSMVINGLEILTALAIASVDGKLVDKIGAVFDIFDFDESGAITLDELCILLKSVVRGLSKITKGLGPRLVALCPMSEVEELAKQCFRHCDLEEEQDLPRELFLQWVKQTPKIINLMRCFVQKEFINEEEAVITIQRCVRGMNGRQLAAQLRFEKQLEIEQEVTQAAQKIHEAVLSRKKKRDTMRQMKIEKFSHHGALYTYGSNTRGHLGHPRLELSRHLTAPLLTAFFKNNELRVVSIAASTVHVCAVTSNGQVFTWGSGVPGSFGFVWKHSLDVPHSGAGGNALLTSHVRKVPTRVDDLDDVNIVECALGNHHSIGLSASGVLFTWGAGSYGQLGHGEFTNDASDIFKRQFDQHIGREYPYVDLPLQLDKSYFEEMRVLQVACGYYFTIALCEDGSVFSWGEGSDGQLGLGYTDNFQVGFLDKHIHGSSFVYMHTPTWVDELKEPIGSIAVGGNHVFAVARDHRNVYEWGAWNRRGGDAQESTFTPQVNQDLSALYVDRIASGKEHSLATTGRVEFTLTVETAKIKSKNRQLEDDISIKALGLCARFGTQPVNLTRSISGSMFFLSSPVRSSLNSDLIASTALSTMVYDRSDAQIRSSLARCTGRVVYLDRGTSTGHWISLLGESSLLEIPCIPAAFGPEITDTGIQAKLFYSPEKLQSLRLYVRPDEIVGKLVVLEFDQDDITFDSDDLELSEMISMIMLSLVEKVKDAQDSGAAAVVIVFDFLDADPFPLEACGDEAFEFLIPTVMVRKSNHGELLLDHITAKKSTRPWGIISYKEDTLGKKVLAAQKAGAKAVIVGQNRIDQAPTRLRKSIFSSGSEKPPATTGVKIPVIMTPFEVGEEIKASAQGADPEDTLGSIAIAGFGHLYAWGYGQNGRLGLGDTENDEIFETGFDGARQISYQYVNTPEPVAALFDKQITYISCGEEHSAAVSSNGTLFCWGNGRDGKLGNGSSDDEYFPVPVDSLASVRVAKVVCGAHQT
uniref:EF-hand domain-containing protein n=1 Tax=Globisporangium ultimum (strain ATCC 200006 / CBS 805.95 / DAOM BR144) TaxID=431595 RepID=K3WZQ3_GLOUD